jgi:hypothetical protein
MITYFKLKKALTEAYPGGQIIPFVNIKFTPLPKVAIMCKYYYKEHLYLVDCTGSYMKIFIDLGKTIAKYNYEEEGIKWH